MLYKNSNEAADVEPPPPPLAGNEMFFYYVICVFSPLSKRVMVDYSFGLLNCFYCPNETVKTV